MQAAAQNEGSEAKPAGLFLIWVDMDAYPREWTREANWSKHIAASAVCLCQSSWWWGTNKSDGNGENKNREGLFIRWYRPVWYEAENFELNTVPRLLKDRIPSRNFNVSTTERSHRLYDICWKWGKRIWILAHHTVTPKLDVYIPLKLTYDSLYLKFPKKIGGDGILSDRH